MYSVIPPVCSNADNFLLVDIQLKRDMVRHIDTSTLYCYLYLTIVMNLHFATEYLLTGDVQKENELLLCENTITCNTMY